MASIRRKLCHTDIFNMSNLTSFLCLGGMSPQTIHSMNIGRAIYGLRKEKGLKLEAVANDAGTDAGYLSRIETGSRLPSLPMLEKIAVAMGVRVSLIVEMAEGDSIPNTSGEMPNVCEADLSEESIQLRQHFRTLSGGNQKALLEIAKVLNRVQRNSEA